MANMQVIPLQTRSHHACANTITVRKLLFHRRCNAPADGISWWLFARPRPDGIPTGHHRAIPRVRISDDHSGICGRISRLRPVSRPTGSPPHGPWCRRLSACLALQLLRPQRGFERRPWQLMGLWHIYQCFTSDWTAWLCTSHALSVRHRIRTATAAAHFNDIRTLCAVDERRPLPPLVRSG